MALAIIRYAKILRWISFIIKFILFTYRPIKICEYHNITRTRVYTPVWNVSQIAEPSACTLQTRQLFHFGMAQGPPAGTHPCSGSCGDRARSDDRSSRTTPWNASSNSAPHPMHMHVSHRHTGTQSAHNHQLTQHVTSPSDYRYAEPRTAGPSAVSGARSTRSRGRDAFSFSTERRRRTSAARGLRSVSVSLGAKAMRQRASGVDWRALRGGRRRRRLHRETGPRVSGRGCGNRLRRNTRHENNRNGECTSAEARRDAFGASETRINTRLFTYGVRERGGGGAARGAIACNPRAAITAATPQFHPNTDYIEMK